MTIPNVTPNTTSIFYFLFILKSKTGQGFAQFEHHIKHDAEVRRANPP